MLLFEKGGGSPRPPGFDASTYDLSINGATRQLRYSHSYFCQGLFSIQTRVVNALYSSKMSPAKWIDGYLAPDIIEFYHTLYIRNEGNAFD